LAGSKLPDGRYELTLFAPGVTDLNGKTLPANYKLSFHVLTGDVNGDAATNDVDFFKVWQNSLKPLGQQDLNNDLDGNGVVNAADVNIVRENYAVTLPPPPLAVTSSVVNNGLTQRSRVTTLTFQFDGNVAASLAFADLQLRNLTTSTDVSSASMTLAYD